MLTGTANIAGTQRGIILIIMLIALATMTLASIAVIRSVETTNLIAGNLAFQQTAIFSAQLGLEAAYTWLDNNRNSDNGIYLQQSDLANGYAALRKDPSREEGLHQSWDEFWSSDLSAQSKTVSADDADNIVSYAIQRLCNTVGPQSSAGCTSPPPNDEAAGSSMNVGFVAPEISTQIYYRVTVRVEGPRHAVGYIQAVVAM